MVVGVHLGAASFTSMADALRRERNTIPPDNGCAESPTCLACLLPACVLDLLTDTRSRQQRMRDLHADGFSIRAIAALEHASMRTVWRALQKA